MKTTHLTQKFSPSLHVQLKHIFDRACILCRRLCELPTQPSFNKNYYFLSTTTITKINRLSGMSSLIPAIRAQILLNSIKMHRSYVLYFCCVFAVFSLCFSHAPYFLFFFGTINCIKILIKNLHLYVLFCVLVL